MKGISSAELKQLKSIFDLFDDHGTNQVSAAILKNTLLTAIQKNPHSQTTDPKQYFQTVTDLDQLKDRLINFDQFVSIFSVASQSAIGGDKNGSGKMSKEEAFRLFRLVDVDNKGRIGYMELKSLMEDIGEIVAPEEIQEMIYRADLNGDGYIDAEEFYSVVSCRHSFAENS